MARNLIQPDDLVIFRLDSNIYGMITSITIEDEPTFRINIESELISDNNIKLSEIERKKYLDKLDRMIQNDFIEYFKKTCEAT